MPTPRPGRFTSWRARNRLRAWKPGSVARSGSAAIALIDLRQEPQPRRSDRHPDGRVRRRSRIRPSVRQFVAYAAPWERFPTTGCPGTPRVDTSDERPGRPRRRFSRLARPREPPAVANPWDVGSAKLLASLGFDALATTSSGFAATLGRLDGSVTRDEGNWSTRRRSLRPPTCPFPPTSRTATPTSRLPSPRRFGSRWRRDWRGARSRTTRAMTTRRSTMPVWPRSASPPRPRRPTPGRRS